MKSSSSQRRAIRSSQRRAIRTKIGRALLSVSDKSGLEAFARFLADRGVEILSTGGTAKALRAAGIPVKDVSEVTGFPEALDGRVKTLHPKIHGGILARRSDPKHRAELERHGIGTIDLVVVNLYPFEKTIARPGCTVEEAIEQIDIGGPSMVRSAAKNHADVAVVVDPADYGRVREEIEQKGEVSAGLRRELAVKAYDHTSRYDRRISDYLASRQQPAVAEGKFPQALELRYTLIQGLRYGENPHQAGAFYRDPDADEPSIARALQLHGKELSYNNVLDSDAALELVKEFSRTSAVIIKHNNPCGVATADTPGAAFARARETDPVSAFGGVVAFNRRVDGPAAEELAKLFLEVVIAPGFSPEALETLRKKRDIRLLEVGEGLDRRTDRWTLRKVVGGLLFQDRDLGRIEDVRSLRVATKRAPTDEEYEALAFAWIVAKHTRSNAIVFARPGQTVGVGAGQMSRVDSVKIAAMKAVLPLAGTAVASDAFFPFRDGIDEAARAGARAVVQPGGSIRDEEVIKAADEHGMAMVFTGMRHFRH